MAKKRTILLVDDSRFFLELEKNVLGEENFDFLTACDGEEALVVALREKPDLILLDLNMPVLGGLDFLKRQRTASEIRDTPVVVVTTRGKDSDVREALQSGARDYVTKPIDNLTLVMKVTSQLSSYRVRMSPRRRIDAEIILSDFEKQHHCMAIDIAPGGLLLRTEAPLQAGQVVDVSFVLETAAGQRAFHLFGEVIDKVASEHNPEKAIDVRIHFMNIGWDDYRFLEDFVAEDDQAITTFITSSPRHRAEGDTPQHSGADLKNVGFLMEINRLIDGLYDVETSYQQYNGDNRALLEHVCSIQQRFSEITVHYRRLKEDFLAAMINDIVVRQLASQRAIRGLITTLIEILESIIGVDRCDILMHDPRSARFTSILSGEEIVPATAFTPAVIEYLREKELYFATFQQVPTGIDNLINPEIVIPFTVRDTLLGCIIVYSLLPQRHLISDLALKVCELLHLSIGPMLFACKRSGVESDEMQLLEITTFITSLTRSPGSDV